MKKFFKDAWNRFLNDETGSICVGCGLDVNGGSGLLEVQLDPAGGITCGASGLAITGAPIASIPVSPDDCNALVKHGNGLYVPCSDGVAGSTAVQASPQGSGLPQALTNGGNYGYLNAASDIDICNTTCCTISGIVFVAVGDIYFDAKPGFVGGGRLQVDINSAGFADVEPSTRQSFQNHYAVNVANNTFLDINQNASFFISLGPTACAHYRFNLQFSITTTGSDGVTGSFLRTDNGGPLFVTRWILTHTDCCDHHN